MLLLIFTSCVTSKVIDYSYTDYIPILDGGVTTYREFGYLRHTSNLTSYYDIVNENQRLIDLFPQSHVKKILISDTEHIDRLLSAVNIHHRHARSLNFIGTALKIIAGTPDFDDFEDSRLKLEQLIASNDKQIQINTKIQIQIVKLTEAVNAILADTKKHQIDSGNLFEILMSRNRMVMFDLQNLMMTITLAKANITNPMILDSDDIKLLVNNLHSTNISVSEILSISSLKILQNLNSVHFIIKYPICEAPCKRISVFPVPHSGKIINFADENTVAECKDKTYAVKMCIPSMTTMFCKITNKTTCAQELVSGTIAHCETQFNHLEPVVEIDDGLVIVNDATVIIKETNDMEKRINGTYLLTFENTIHINGTVYVNRNNILKRNPGTPTFPMINITQHLKTLSLPMLHEMNLDNLNHISQIKEETKTQYLPSPALLHFPYSFFAMLRFPL